MVLKMQKKLLLLISISALFLLGCRTLTPVYNVDNAPIISLDNKSIKMASIKVAILRSGISLGWLMQPISEGVINGTIALRHHVAKIKILYNKDNYSIQYVDSEKLNYDGTNIHPNYNGWIKNLNNSIQASLTGVEMKHKYPLGVLRR
jgi:hypothetical protein